jgi:hypothetical protein
VRTIKNILAIALNIFVFLLFSGNSIAQDSTAAAATVKSKPKPVKNTWGSIWMAMRISGDFLPIQISGWVLLMLR